MEFERWYTTIPPVTRTFLTAAVVTSLAVTYEFVNPLDLYLNWALILEKQQWWRLITCFVFFDRLGVNLFFNLHFLYITSRRLEEHFFGVPGGYCLMLLLGAGALTTCASWVDMPFMSYPFTMMVLYIWSRRYPEENVQLYWLFTVSATYFPYVMIGLSYAFGNFGTTRLDAVGMLVGHVLWYLADIFPLIAGFSPLHAPAAFLAMFAAGPREAGLRAQEPQQPAAVVGNDLQPRG